VILELDLGNSRTKWRVIDAQGQVSARGCNELSVWTEQGFPAEWPQSLSRIRIASVRDEKTLKTLVERLRLRYSALIEVAEVSACCAGVRNGYAQPQLLGVDRWLAMVAAHNQSGSAVLVVDVGSAMTIDLVDRSGRHHGGYIVPGLAMMRQSLLGSTDRVRYDADGRLESLGWGDDTASCALNGTLLALAAAVEHALTDSQRLLGESPSLYLTGGDAERLLLLPGLARSRYCPELVLDGLRYLFP
jgi:type III pantothenate kinase